MVYLNRIYTRTGDSGETSLGDGSRVAKTDPRIAACGGVDELNAVIGLAITTVANDEFRRRLQLIQNDLFDAGADLCIPETPPENADRDKPAPLRVSEKHVAALERWIDEANARLKPLTSFVLPGGTATAAHLHHARAVCRRAEIAVLALAERETITPQLPVYLNRLSDLLFVLARVANNNGETDVLWVPGG
ncbi:MAG: cob(I)yrinic acid a,c-diamide adenosyltransferase [Planctomycetaceae bacterium]